MKADERISETFRLGALLAMVGGFLDAYSYVTRGQVFATAETGNIVLMGLNLAQGNGPRALRYLLPISVYALGILVAKWIHEEHTAREISLLHWRQIIIVLEAVVLLGVTFIPQSDGWNLVANGMIAFVSSMQVQSFRRLRGGAFATTMCTGNLRSGVDTLYRAMRSHDRSQARKSLRYFGIIAGFVLGVVISFRLTAVFGRLAMPFAVAVLVVVYLMLLAEPLEADGRVNR